MRRQILECKVGEVCSICTPPHPTQHWPFALAICDGLVCRRWSSGGFPGGLRSTIKCQILRQRRLLTRFRATRSSQQRTGRKPVGWSTVMLGAAQATWSFACLRLTTAAAA
jgi:hypothetical protein